MTIPLNTLPFVHHILSQHLRYGDCAVDGTAGNGNDSLHLAQCVGETGQVWAFDIQSVAIERTRQLLAKQQLLSRVQLILDGHQHIDRYIQQPIDAAVLNLGYLPQGDKTRTTQYDSTLTAIIKILNLLKKNGILTVTLYGGHEAGKAECTAVEQFAAECRQQDFDILRYQFANRPTTAPYALIFRKIKEVLLT